MNLSNFVEKVVSHLAQDDLLRCREEYARLSGGISPEEADFEARTSLFFDWLLVYRFHGLHSNLVMEAHERDLLSAIQQSHDSVFAVEDVRNEFAVIRCLRFAARYRLWSADGLALRTGDRFQARLVRAGLRCTVLPGIFFHPRNSAPELDALVALAQNRNMAPEELFFALLRIRRRMERFPNVRKETFYNEQSLEDLEIASFRQRLLDKKHGTASDESNAIPWSKGS